MIYKRYKEIDLKIFNSREEMGEAAAKEASEVIVELLKHKEFISCIFAAAPSQQEFLEALSKEPLPWNRINAFHMDEYIGLQQGSPESFSGFLGSAIFNKLPFCSVNLINGLEKPDEECKRYASLLESYSPDIVFMGIGENGHIAFNDPGVADFNDPYLVKTVTLDHECRMQQVNDKCFPSLDKVPEEAITLTIPALLSAPYVFCIVPGIRKAKATAAALEGEVEEKCPASILQRKKGCRMYIDKDSSSDLKSYE
ncbi:glucosamine-6-phosphate deaminase [Alloiococcus sp. CFN-8]|uniref:glucosamine-6-phosphate deaminase n=1 Tax=Alloiococcus sp. CFN-8 TaxID=3416081 RepID=UPI003CFA3DB9